MAINSICFLLLLIPNADSLSFDFRNIKTDSRDNFTYAGTASVSDDGIQVTPALDIPDKRYSATGRVTYIEPLHLWDSNSGELASFSTSFVFVIDSYQKDNYSDGMAFFLAQNTPVIEGFASMGLPFDNLNMVSESPFVAVEFDTYSNNDEYWDEFSLLDHVGININNLSSVRKRTWFSDIPNGKECRALIQYDSDSKNLSVSFTGFQNSTVVMPVLYYTIDLRDVLPEWVIFGFSAATSITLFEKNNVKSWVFNSSTLHVDQKSQNPRKWKKKTGHMVGLIVGSSIVVTFLGMLVVFVLRRRKKHNGDEAEELGFDAEMKNEFEAGATGPRRFSYLELARLTAGFAKKQKLGEGGFGGVYKGFIKDLGIYVAIKRVSKKSKQGIKEYASEVKIVSQLRHRNLVQLTGWCHEKGQLLLVYEFMENGSLDLHLFKGKSLLTWSTRYKIAHGLATALLYLHEEWEQCVLHRDIKSSNVMLDSNFNAKLGDFGLAKLVDHEKGSHTTMLAGTLGYMAPECVATGKATKESDVFSFGVVALEITCGRKAIEYKAQENQMWLIQWVWEVYGTKTLLEAVDGRLGLDFEEEEIKRLMMVGLWCVHPDSKLRPTIRQVIQVLNSEASLPALPSKMPVASYLTPPISSLVRASNVDLSNNMTLSTPSSYLYGR